MPDLEAVTISTAATIMDNPLLAAQAHRFFQSQVQVIHDCLGKLDGHREDADTVHDLRVATRRFTSVLQQLQPYLDPDWCRLAEQAVRPLRKRTNRLRDSAVLQLRLQKLAAQGPDGLETGLIAAWLDSRQHQLLDKMRRKLAGSDHRRRLAQLAADLKDESRTPDCLRALPDSTGLYALATLKDIRATLLFQNAANLLVLRHMLVARTELPAEVLADPVLAARFLEISPALIHRIRLAAKDFRYALEFLAPVLATDSLQAWLESFRHWQDLLGTVHDLDLALARMDDMEKHAPSSADLKAWQREIDTMKKVWREERQTLLDQLQSVWPEWTAEALECKISELIFQNPRV